MLRIIYCAFVLICLRAQESVAAGCENGWTAYADELCITHVDSLVTYEDAKNMCASLGDDTSLIVVKDSYFQDFLSQYTQDLYDTLWLGAKYDNNSYQFVWEDGDPLSYTNWAEGYPHNNTEVESCLELRPPLAKEEEPAESKWADVSCLKRNMVMCQKSLVWTLQDAVNEIKYMRKQLIPIGSVHVQYPKQPSPPTLWQNFVWEDITNSYEGMFFRALGGGSEEWEGIQAECAPRVTQMAYEQTISDNPVFYPVNINVPAEGWSPALKGGEFFMSGTKVQEGMKVLTENCEIRPRNQAIKLWKRTS